MDVNRLRDRAQWGLNIVARAIGSPADAYRATGSTKPLDPRNRYLRLHVAFSSSPGELERPSTYGSALCYGYFDAAYTQPGDYLVQDDRTVFIGEQQSFAPALCIRTNRIVTFRRPPAPSGAGQAAYGGGGSGTSITLMEDWPASVLGTSGSGTPPSGVPSEITVPMWTVLLPAPEGVTLLPSDLMSDELGRQAVVTSAELSHLGWRLIVKQLTA